MLSFGSRLAGSLKNSNTTSFWVLKLYYNDESAFIGLSDRDRQDGSDFYYGLISSWGSYSQSLDFNNFTTSTSNMTISVINTYNSINGKRFSDLLSIYNFSNRKWELFLNTAQTSTYDGSAKLIGTGVISGNIKYDYKKLSLLLIDKSSIIHKTLPSSTLGTTSGIPKNNKNKPIPMSYGNFYEKDIGTIPTTYFDRFKNFYRSAFPAIISNQFDATDELLTAKIENSAVHTLDSENVYYYSNGYYATIMSTDVDATTNNPEIDFNGIRCKVYIPLSTDNFATSGTGSQNNVANMVNGAFNDSSTGFISTTDGNTRNIFFGIPKVPSMGSIVSTTAIAKLGNVTGSGLGSNLTIGASSFALNVGGGINGNDEIEATVNYTTDQKSNWDLEGRLQISLTSASGSGNAKVEIVEVGLVIEFDIDDIETHEVLEYYETTVGDAVGTLPFISQPLLNKEIVLTRTRTTNYPANYDFIYASGRGRKYGSWIDADSRNNGYDQNQVLQNPIYIIEDILRNELSLTSSDIDYALFDIAGNDTNGHIKEPFNEDDTRDIKFAFSQYKFINSKELIFRICKQAFTWFWISGDGKAKVRTLFRPSDTFSVDKTIDFSEINLKSLSQTSLNNVRNDITVNYNYDYGSTENMSKANSTDSTSAGNTVDGYNQALEFSFEAEHILDDTTATKMANGYKEIFKDRKVQIEFDVMTAKHNDLEITDHITFSNWDSNLKLYGSSFSSDVFIVASISKKVNGCSIKAIKVDA